MMTDCPAPNTNIEVFLQHAKERVNQTLVTHLNALQDIPAPLHEAMTYSIMGGGKRIRPALVYATGELFDAPQHALDQAACAVELIHCYSLVHDDLPAMDDDRLRRGRPTCHVAFDEATALLVGDGLQSLAFELLSECPQVQDSQRLAMSRCLAKAIGPAGMVGGQMLDCVGNSLRQQATLDAIHHKKTGALIRACVQLGALCSDKVSSQQRARLDTYARAFGLAFQIQDDILDSIGSQALLGKEPGTDKRNEKITYPVLLGLNKAIEQAQHCHHEALAALLEFSAKARPLRELSQYVISRIRLADLKRVS